MKDMDRQNYARLRTVIVLIMIIMLFPYAAMAQHWKAQAKKADLAFIRSEMPTAVGQSIHGVEQDSSRRPWS